MSLGQKRVKRSADSQKRRPMQKPAVRSLLDGRSGQEIWPDRRSLSSPGGTPGLASAAPKNAGTISTWSRLCRLWWFGYVVALASVLLATLWRGAMEGVLGDTSQYTTYYPAVMLTAVVGGLWPGLLATVLGAVLGDWLFVGTRTQSAIGDPDDVARLLMFVLTGVFSSILAERLRASRREAQTHLEALRQVEWQFDRFVNGNIIGYIVTDAESIRQANDVFLDMVGCSREDLSAGPLSCTQMTPPEYRLMDETALQDLVERGACAPYEKEFIRRDCSRLPVLIGASRLSEDPLTWLASVLDLTKLRAAEEELSRANAELARSNSELEQYALVISHDLRSPLTSIDACVQLLMETCREQDSRTAEIAGYVRDGIKQMASLISSLLSYSRVGKGELCFQDCPMGSVVDAAARSLKADIDRTCASVSHNCLPTVRGDENLLCQLIQNLLENAIKYRGDEPPRVRVEAEELGREWVFSVTDNGIGIDPAHFNRLFHIFQRVHNDQKQCEGSGVGLATCKKIVERHGGRIWVESEPGKGSTFHFTLPK